MTYATPLDARLMPLCGNGVVDSMADYLAYFSRVGGGLLVKRGVLGLSDENVTEVQLSMDEVCDDGNRLDGDGCSADCLNLDALGSACELAVEAAELYEDFLFFPGTESALVTSATGLYLLEATDRGLLVPVLLVPKSFAVLGMMLFGAANASRLQLFAFSGEAVYALVLDVATMRPVGGFARHMSVDVLNTNEPAFFWTNRTHVLLVCKDNRAVHVVDVLGRRLLASAVAAALPPAQFYYAWPGTALLLVKMEGGLMATVDVGAARIQISAASNGTMDFWYEVGQRIGMDLTHLAFVQPEFHVTFRPPLSWAESVTNRLQTELNQGFARMLHPLLVMQQLAGPRWLLQPSGPRMLFLGPERLLNALNTPNTAWPNTLNATGLNALNTAGPNTLNATGLNALNATGLNALNATGLNAMGPLSPFLGMPLACDVLSKTLCPPSMSSPRTYFDLLSEAVANNGTSEGLQRFGLAVKQHVQLVTRWLEHPVSRSWWVLQEGKLKEMSLTGATVEREGKCAPTCARLCASTCQWSPDCGRCVPCTSVPSVKTARQRLEWQLQCQPCVQAMGLGRRLLTSDGAQSIVLVLGGCARADVLGQFPEATVVPMAAEAWEVVVTTAEPQRAMREVQARLAGPSACVVLTRPRLRLVEAVDSSASFSWCSRWQSLALASLVISVLRIYK
jgi:cysteine-rich repeat protein